MKTFLYRNALRLAHHFPGFRRIFWHRAYEFLAQRYPHEIWTFMNYGYAPVQNETPVALNPADEPDRYCIQMYHRVAGAVDLSGCRVLEVGCGRGGGASYIMRYLKPECLIGVDISEKAIAFCRMQHQVEGLTFETGDAEALPFPDETYDAVVNIESSHCYGSIDAFFREVYRVLRPGGHFLFADFRYPQNIPPLREALLRAGFVLRKETDITGRVFQALDTDSDRKQMLIRDHIDGSINSSFEQFAGVRGTRPHRNFRDGLWHYTHFVLQKG